MKGMDMEVRIGKMANHFTTRFERFGSGRPMNVTRITRPHLLRYDEYCPQSLDPIQIDLLDDITDLARPEALLQLRRQSHGELFHLVVETVDSDRQTVERWRLEECRIVDCRFDELTAGD